MSDFDPSAPAVKNGRYFGFPYSEEDADILILPAPWDATTSYGDGTHLGPNAVLEASTQLDFHSPYRERAWESKIGSISCDSTWHALNAEARVHAKSVIASLEAGGPAGLDSLRFVNEAGKRFHGALEKITADALKSGKKVVTLGGDHSVSLGPIRAHGTKFPQFSVLHIDAHADLRDAYCGFNDSHASIMHQVSRLPFVDALVQVGLRDLAPQELAEASENPKIHPFFDWDLKRNTARGQSWLEQCHQIIKPLGENVYLSLDVDGLDPKYCPGTGTPVPGGLELWELLFLLEETERSGRRFIGADLVEVAPSEGEWDANVGARILFQLCQFLRPLSH